VTGQLEKVWTEVMLDTNMLCLFVDKRKLVF